MPIMLFIQLSYTLALLAFILQRTHLLITLLCLEGIILTLVLLVPSFLYFSGIRNILVFALIMLTLGACEARVGLRILVNITRLYGTDILKSTTLNKC